MRELVTYIKRSLKQSVQPGIPHASVTCTYMKSAFRLEHDGRVVKVTHYSSIVFHPRFQAEFRHMFRMFAIGQADIDDDLTVDLNSNA